MMRISTSSPCMRARTVPLRGGRLGAATPPFTHPLQALGAPTNTCRPSGRPHREAPCFAAAGAGHKGVCGVSNRAGVRVCGRLEGGGGGQQQRSLCRCLAPLPTQRRPSPDQLPAPGAASSAIAAAGRCVCVSGGSSTRPVAASSAVPGCGTTGRSRYRGRATPATQWKARVGAHGSSSSKMSSGCGRMGPAKRHQQQHRRECADWWGHPPAPAAPGGWLP